MHVNRKHDYTVRSLTPCICKSPIAWQITGLNHHFWKYKWRSTGLPVCDINTNVSFQRIGLYRYFPWHMCVTCCPFLRAVTLSWSLSCSATSPSTSPDFSGEYHTKLLWVVKEEGAETSGSFWVSSWATKRERAGRLESWMKAGFGGLSPQLRVLGLWGQHWVSHNQMMEALVVSSAFWRTVWPLRSGQLHSIWVPYWFPPTLEDDFFTDRVWPVWQHHMSRASPTSACVRHLLSDLVLSDSARLQGNMSFPKEANRNDSPGQRKHHFALCLTWTTVSVVALVGVYRGPRGTLRWSGLTLKGQLQINV